MFKVQLKMFPVNCVVKKACGLPRVLTQLGLTVRVKGVWITSGVNPAWVNRAGKNLPHRYGVGMRSAWQIYLGMSLQHLTAVYSIIILPSPIKEVY